MPRSFLPLSPSSLWGKLGVLWRFSRPHTIIGTSLSVAGLFAIAAATFPAPSPWTLLWAWIACLGGNLYIVGLNQLEDVAIDRINKPDLPLAAGDLSLNQGRWIVGVSGGLAIAIAASQGYFLLATVGISLIIGTAYSLPPLRLKRFALWASFCILAVRGAVVNLGLYLHYSDRAGLPPQVSTRVWALAVFVLGFSIAIAIFKDIPDLPGDRQHRIATLTVKLGQKTVFNLARWVLTVCYGGLAIAAFFLDVNQPLLIGSHLGILAWFWWASLGVIPATDDAAAEFHAPDYPAFYQFIWKLFFLEYLLFPLACWLA